MKLSDFRNITAFRLTDEDQEPVRELDLALTEEAITLAKPVGFALSTTGFINLIDGADTKLDMTEDKGSALRHRVYSRMITSQVIKDELDTWTTEFEEKHKREPYKEEVSAKRLQLETVLIPQAFIKHKDTYVLRSFEKLIITTATDSLSDTIKGDFLDLAEQGTCIKPFLSQADLIDKLTYWAKGVGLGRFEVDPEGSFLLTRDKGGSQVRGRGIDVTDKRFLDLLDQGYRVVRLPLIQIDTETSFQIDTKGHIRALHFPQFANVRQDYLGEEYDQVAEDLATLAVMRSMIMTLLLDLQDEINGVPVDGEYEDGGDLL